MKSTIKKVFNTLFDVTFWNYAIVGCINTAVGAGIMFLCYNAFHFTYWFSAALNHLAGSITGYFLNKHFTFKYRERNWKIVLKYIFNVLACYIVGYGIAKPLMRKILFGSPKTVQENIAMVTGLLFYIGMNYLNQRFYLFKKKEEDNFSIQDK